MGKPAGHGHRGNPPKGAQDIGVGRKALVGQTIESLFRATMTGAPVMYFTRVGSGRKVLLKGRV
jgi:hypothetical protein